MRKTTYILASLLSAINLKAQEVKFRENIDKDSLFNVSIQKLPIEMREEYSKTFKEGNEETKEFLLFMISMPKSSKKKLIENFENKNTEINNTCCGTCANIELKFLYRRLGCHSDQSAANDGIR